MLPAGRTNSKSKCVFENIVKWICTAATRAATRHITTDATRSGDESVSAANFWCGKATDESGGKHTGEVAIAMVSTREQLA